MYLRERGYARFVIVSHSQGTVISADLLRYLHVQGRLSEIVGATPLSLVTVGCPLRDLFSERFPLLYRWMGSNQDGFASATPNASDIGAVEWSMRAGRAIMLDDLSGCLPVTQSVSASPPSTPMAKPKSRVRAIERNSAWAQAGIRTTSAMMRCACGRD